MKRLILFFSSFFIYLAHYGQELNYYLPDSVVYDPSVPKPKDIIYHEVGEWHVTHDRLVNYMKAVATAMPSRIKLETVGFTYEKRPQVLLVITSPENHQRLEEIRQRHIQLTDPKNSGSLNIDNMPAVVWIGHSIHGNEASGANASLLTAYYLAAARGKDIDELLRHTVILFDPSFNPDGLQRFSTWVNQHRGKNLVTDPSSREFNEVWPGGRYNHYWFDLNRDWLPAVHIESQNRLKWFHHWKPNVLTDHHEQGSNATFFFQPGIPSRVNPLTPWANQELTAKLGTFHAKFLDRIGSLYFTRESYDDFYYGKGSTYPDVQGSIGILFEQASSRGHLQQTNNGLLSFPFTIRNQFVTALSTLEGSLALRKELLEYQRKFFKDALADAASDPVKAYLLGGEKMPEQLNLFLETLKRHQVDFYPLSKDVTANGLKFSGGTNFIIPVQQPQYRLIKSIFEKTLTYKDSLFYDITAWTMPLAFGLPYTTLNAKDFNNELLGRSKEGTPGRGFDGRKSLYGYVMDWRDIYAPAALFELQAAGILTKVATEPFESLKEFDKDNSHPFLRGSIFIPVQQQSISADSLYNVVSKLAGKYKVYFKSVHSGSVQSGKELGSGRFVSLVRPSIALIAGPGVNALDAGEVWHLLDQRMNIPVSLLEPAIFNRTEIGKYNTIIMAGGSYSDINKDKLKSWVQSGGCLVLTEEAVSWASQAGITEVKFKKLKGAADSTQKLNYRQRELVEGAQQMSGAIFEAGVDLEHPLAFGYDTKSVNLFKGNKVFMEKSRNPYATPFYYGSKPLVSGWVSRENAEAVSNSAAVIASVSGSGRVINIADNPNFRGFWLGGSKIFLNAIFFGRIIEAATARTD
jgi:hypothetical protein